jgi:hypothetical protein
VCAPRTGKSHTHFAKHIQTQLLGTHVAGGTKHQAPRTQAPKHPKHTPGTPLRNNPRRPIHSPAIWGARLAACFGCLLARLLLQYLYEIACGAALVLLLSCAQKKPFSLIHLHLLPHSFFPLNNPSIPILHTTTKNKLLQTQQQLLPALLKNTRILLCYRLNFTRTLSLRNIVCRHSLIPRNAPWQITPKSNHHHYQYHLIINSSSLFHSYSLPQQSNYYLTSLR